jgi:hypothetical protein
VLSRLALARRFPSGLKATLNTASLWPRNNVWPFPEDGATKQKTLITKRNAAGSWMVGFTMVHSRCLKYGYFAVRVVDSS